MFLLLMPIFAAPLEGLAALSASESLKELDSFTDSSAVFISVGVPMYYLTAPSRLDNRSRVEDGSGIRGTCRGQFMVGPRGEN